MNYIPIERVERPSPEMLYRKYISRNRPVVISGLANTWPAVLRWTPAYLKSCFGDEVVRLRAAGSDHRAGDSKSRLADFIDSMRSANDPNEHVLAFAIFKHFPKLRADIEPLDSYMGLPSYYPQRLRRQLIAEPRFFLGPAGYGAGLHFDGRNNFFLQVHGRKRFVLISPRQSRYVYYPMDYPSTYFSPVDITKPDLEAFPLLKKVNIIEAQIGPGDILFIPVRWWHSVLALEDSISLSSWWGSASVMLRMWHPSMLTAKGKLRDSTKQIAGRWLKTRSP